MELVKKLYIDGTTRDIKNATKKRYNLCLKNLYKILKLQIDENVIIKLRNYSDVIKIFDESEFSDSMKRSLFSFILVLLDAYKGKDKIYPELHKVYLEKLKEYAKIGTQKLKNNEKEKMVNDKNVLLKIADLRKVSKMWERKYKKDKTEMNLFYWLIASLYSNIRYPRRNIYATVKIIDDAKKDNKKDNFLVLSKNSYFIFNDHKTSRKYGQQILKINKNSVFLTVLRVYLAERNDSSENLLISPYGHKKLNSSQLTKFIKEVYKPIGKNIGSSTIRKIFISDKFKDDTPIEKRKAIALGMGHSTFVQQNYYEKKN